MDPGCTNERQASLPQCLRRRRPTHLCIRRILRQHRTRNQRHDRNVRSRQKPVANADRPNEESALGLQRTRDFQQRDPSDWRKEHEQKWRSAPVQCKYQELEAFASYELVACQPQIFLHPKQDIRYRWRLRHVLRSV